MRLNLFLKKKLHIKLKNFQLKNLLKNLFSCKNILKHKKDHIILKPIHCFNHHLKCIMYIICLTFNIAVIAFKYRFFQFGAFLILVLKCNFIVSSKL